MAHDIYDFDAQLKGVERLIENSDISESNKKLLFNFKKHLLKKGKKKRNGKEVGLSKGRTVKILKNARKIVIWLGKDFKKITKAEKEKIEEKIDNLEVERGGETKKISAWTWRDYKLALKGLLDFVGKKKLAKSVDASVDTEDGSERYRPVESKHPEDMITEDEMIALLKAALNPRDKAFISLAFDIGPRPHEIGRLTIKDVKITEEGGTVTLPDRSKTGRRYVPIVFSIPYLYMWLRVHPLKGNKNAPLWVGLDKRTFAKPMTYPAIRKVILSVAKRANLEKRVHTYLFRHSSATHAASHSISEFEMDSFYGWVIGSKAPKTYIKMVAENLKNSSRKRFNLKVKEKEISKLTPKICPRCEWFNEFDAKKCFKCGSSLDKTYALELERKKEVGEKALNELFQDDEVKDVIMKKLAEKPELIKQLLAS